VNPGAGTADAAAQPEGVPALRRVVLRPVDAANALERTTARLLQTIRLGAVAPGEALPPERELAGDLGVSRDTVREAIRELADAGYVVTRRGRYGGTFVVDPLPPAAGVSAEELDGVLGLRSVLEPGAARAAAARTLTAEQRLALGRALTATVTAAPDDYRRADTALHLLIAELAGIPPLVALVVESRTRMTELLDRFPLLSGNIEHSTAQHRAVVGAILSGDPDAAERAMREHLAGSEELVRGFLG
jgi:DNA-binding FadR family transcriptional regulator